MRRTRLPSHHRFGRPRRRMFFVAVSAYHELHHNPPIRPRAPRKRGVEYCRFLTPTVSEHWAETSGVAARSLPCQAVVEARDPSRSIPVVGMGREVEGGAARDPGSRRTDHPQVRLGELHPVDPRPILGLDGGHELRPTFLQRATPSRNLRAVRQKVTPVDRTPACSAFLATTPRGSCIAIRRMMGVREMRTILGWQGL